MPPPVLRSLRENWLRAALDLLFPPRCASCVRRLTLEERDGISASGYCGPCGRTLERIEPPFCQICAEPFPGELHHTFTCPNCAGQKFAFEFAVSGWLASGALRDAIHRFKYERQIQLRGLLAGHLRDALNDPRLAGETGWVLVPVPLHHRRFRERTFNQSEELARELSKRTGFPWFEALRRIRYTTSQVSLTGKERMKNLKDAFALRRRAAERLRGRPVLLIDDVFTTGSTVHECARILQSAEPSRIAVITAVRG